MSLQDLVKVSNKYGSDPDWVLAGGGNTSFKDESTLWIKASGFQLSTIGEDGFARMDRAALQKIWRSSYPDEQEAREAEALRELMAARVDGETRRPSVETLMHELFPFPLVVHTHPALVNGLTCGQQGELYANRLFSSKALWVPAIEPGYILAKEIQRLAGEHQERTGSFPQIVFLQNHGLVVAGRDAEEIRRLQTSVKRTIKSHVKHEPDLAVPAGIEGSRDQWLAALELAFGDDVSVSFGASVELLKFLESPETFAPLMGAFSPDHIVYAGTYPLYAPAGARDAAAGLRTLIADYEKKHGTRPRVIAVPGVGAFGVESNEHAAGLALLLFTDQVKIAAYAESFGGYRHLDSHLIEFIESWEVERYRKKTSAGT